MTVGIALIRGINVVGNNRLPMETLRVLCEKIGLRGARTWIQSGNVVFRCEARSLPGAAMKLETAIEKTCGFRPNVMVRALDELRGVCSTRAFKDHDALHPGRLLVMFLAKEGNAGAKKVIDAIVSEGKCPERFVICGREVFLYFPNGVGKAALSMAAVERALGTKGTCRNWNTVTKLLAMGEQLDGAA